MRGLVYIFLALFLGSCMTHKNIPQVVEKVIRDTVNVVRVDTVRQVIKQNVKDSTSRDKVVREVLDSLGNVKKREVTTVVYKYAQNNELVDYYRAKYDSLSKARVDSVPYPVYVEKNLSRWQSAKVKYGGYAFLLCAGFFVWGAKMLFKKYVKKE